MARFHIVVTPAYGGHRFVLLSVDTHPEQVVKAIKSRQKRKKRLSFTTIEIVDTAALPAEPPPS
jgi:hypothetical protein